MAAEKMVGEQWFPPSQLAFYFDSNAWAKGTALYLRNEVLQADWVATADGEWRIDAQVQGSLSQPYELQAQMRVSASGNLQSWRSACTCPVGRMCKHSAAVGIHTAMQGKAFLPRLLAAAAHTDAQQLVQRQAQALDVADHQLRDWLQRLDAAGQAQSSASGNLFAPFAPAKPDWFVYVVSASVLGRKPLLLLTVKKANRKASGEWNKPRKVSHEPAPSDSIWQQMDAQEKGVFDLLKACPGHSGFTYYGFQNQVRLQGAAAPLLLQMCASTGRLVWEGDGAHTPLQWSPKRLAFVTAWRSDAGDAPPVPPVPNLPAAGKAPAGWQLQLQLDQPTAQWSLAEPALYADPLTGQCGLIDTQGLTAEQLFLLTQAPTVPEAVALKYHDQMLTHVGALTLPPGASQVPEIIGQAPAAALQVLVQDVPFSQRHAQAMFALQLRFVYGDHHGHWAHDRQRVVVGQGEHTRHLVRDLAAEAQWVSDLHDFGLHEMGEGLFVLEGSDAQDTWMDWLERDFEPLRQAGFELLKDPELSHWLRSADEVYAAMDSGAADDASPWFDLSLGMEINGERVNILPWVPDILRSLRQAGVVLQGDALTPSADWPAHVYVPDPQGPGHVKLPTQALRDWLSVLLELQAERGEGVFDAAALKLSRLDALRAAAALGEGVQWQGAAQLQAVVRQMRGQAALPEVPPPEGLQAALRPYQQQGLNWLQFLRQHHLAGILADDMGLGKTLQTLAHILTEKQAGRLQTPALIVAPVSLLGNWQREAARFCPDLRTHLHHGLSRHTSAQDLQGFDVVITAYSLLSRDRLMWASVPWHLLVLDEAQHIKNANTHAAQVASDMQATHRLCLSGTPIENHLGELWSQFHFLMPGFLGSQRRFAQWFRGPIERQGDAEKLAQLRARVTPFMLRRTKALVASELPPKIETTMPVPLLGKQADVYESIRMGMEKTVRQALSTQGLGKSHITILDALLKLRQVCCDPRLLKMGAATQVKQSAKLEQLLQMLPEMVAEGRKILLFSQFTQMLGLIEQELPQLGIPWVKLTGQSKNRDAIIDTFTSGQVPLFLISLKAGGVGLNLPQADTVIHYDPWWNPAVENQATDRAHRIGQTQSVWVVKLVAQGTIEERMLALQERKAALASDLYSASVQRKQPLFGEDDLTELFKPLGP